MARPSRSRSRTLPPPGGEGRARVVIEDVQPDVDGGRFPAKAVAGDPVRVECDAFADGHDLLRCRLRWRPEGARAWREVEMRSLPNDRWRAEFVPEAPGLHWFEIEAWVDPFGTWLRDLHKRVDAGQDVTVDLAIGAELVDRRARSAGRDARPLRAVAERLRAGVAPDALTDLRAALDGDVRERMNRADPRAFATRTESPRPVAADRERAAFSAWYEFFPRSTGRDGRHGTFATAADFLPYVADLGFDVVYLPPIHPIGLTKRKGRNNRVEAEPGDVGSPWAIGAAAGGHTAIEPALGTLADFYRFQERAHALGLEVALDVAFQCSPDHPWVREHPTWFRHRPDGSIQYAENPPKKYQDIYPLDFESEDWKDLWDGLQGVFEFWMDQGVRIFRVDNPHTKALPFWTWCLPRLKRRDPGVIFLSEAFTRPKVMYHLAKLGFTQSYTYFAWRHHRGDLAEYVRELGRAPVRHFFRPNFWPNTPDILTETLQRGGRPAFALRAVLAATLAANWGIYGPAFELLEHVPREPGSEEYLDSEKYQLRTWDLDRPDSLRPLIARLNRARRGHPALQRDGSLHVHGTDNDQLLCYGKRAQRPGPTADDPPTEDVILVVVNLDPEHRQSGWTRLDLAELGLGDDEEYEVHDLLGDARYVWRGARNYVELDPAVAPAHVFEIVRRPRSERDFDYWT